MPNTECRKQKTRRPVLQDGGLRSAMLETLHHTRADTTGLRSRLIRFRQAMGRIARGMIIRTIVPPAGWRQTESVALPRRGMPAKLLRRMSSSARRSGRGARTWARGARVCRSAPGQLLRSPHRCGRVGARRRPTHTCAAGRRRAPSPHAPRERICVGPLKVGCHTARRAEDDVGSRSEGCCADCRPLISRRWVQR
jgi:hypothetical protein